MSRVLNLFAQAHGQCRLVFVSSTSIRLDPFNGRNLAIAGLLEQVPSAGVSISNASLAANTVYYVYARMNAGVMALELSTTGHSQDATTGVRVKTGDATRTLVGMVRTNGSSQFVEDATNLCVLSYFNRRRKIGRANFTANRTQNYNLTFSEINTEIRVNFLSWDDSSVLQSITGSWAVSVNGSAATCYASIDGSTTNPLQAPSTTITNQIGFTSSDERNVSEGYHYGSLLGSCYLSPGSSVTYVGGQNGQVSQVLSVLG